MKKTKTLLLLIAFSFFANAQNLIPNNSFETNSGLPSAGNQLNLCTGWSNVNGTYFPSYSTGSPDYYHMNGTGGVKLPNTTYAYVNPNTGNACAGFSTWNDNATSFREYLSIKLLDPYMIQGKIYNVSFYLTNGTNCNYNYQTNNIGIRFSKNSLTQNGYQVINAVPQIEITNIVSAPAWQLFSFQYTADSAYQYITIGNFRTDQNTSITQINSTNNPYGYYYIDDISITDVTAVQNYDLQNNIIINPNPVSISATIHLEKNVKNANMIVYNYCGQEVKKINNISGDIIHFDRNDLPDGMYFLHLIEDGKIISLKKIMIH